MALTIPTLTVTNLLRAECTRSEEQSFLEDQFQATYFADAQYNQAQLALLTFPTVVASAIAIPAAVISLAQVTGFLVGVYEVGFQSHRIQAFLNQNSFVRGKDHLYFDFMVFHCFETVYNPISRNRVRIPGPNIFVPFVGLNKI